MEKNILISVLCLLMALVWCGFAFYVVWVVGVMGFVDEWKEKKRKQKIRWWGKE